MRYTPEMHTFFEEYIPGHHYNEIVAEFERRFNVQITQEQVHSYTRNHKIKTGFNGQYKKGYIPPNKGKTWDDYLTKDQQERARMTTFKKCNIPHNKARIGDEALTTGDNYVKVKIGEPNKWEFKHKLVWREHFGEIPPGMAITFRDGNRQNCSIENLRLVSKRALTHIAKFCNTEGKARDTAITLAELRLKIKDRRQQDGNHQRKDSNSTKGADLRT